MIVRMIEQRPFTPFELGNEALFAHSPTALPSEMTIYFDDQTASPDDLVAIMKFAHIL